MKKLLLIPLLLFLVGCQSTQPTLVKDRLVVIDIPQKLYEGCEIIKDFPNWKTLTDPEVAETIVTLYENNVKCYNVVEAIKKHQIKAKRRIGQG
jgi:uncharacterized protein YcfL